MEAIQHRDLCATGKALDGRGLGMFIEHINKCKKCKKLIIKNREKCIKNK